MEYTTVYFDDIETMATNAEQQAPTIGSGLHLLNGASVISDPLLVIAGNASLRLKNYGAVSTNPTVLPLSGGSTYSVEFQYHILGYGSSDQGCT